MVDDCIWLCIGTYTIDGERSFIEDPRTGQGTPYGSLYMINSNNSVIKYHTSYAVVFYDFFCISMGGSWYASLRSAWPRRATVHASGSVLCKSTVASYWGTTASVTRRVIPILYDSKYRVMIPTAVVHRLTLYHPSLLWLTPPNRLYQTHIRHDTKDDIPVFYCGLSCKESITQNHRQKTCRMQVYRDLLPIHSVELSIYGNRNRSSVSF